MAFLFRYAVIPSGAGVQSPDIRQRFCHKCKGYGSGKERTGMQHTYDDEGFFQAYAHMPRSRAGLAAAGEWGQLRPLFPQVAGKAVLDLGCGYG